MPRPLVWAPALLAWLALVSAEAAAGDAERPRLRSGDSARAFLIDIERGVRKVSEEANLTFSALDTYGRQLEMTTAEAANTTAGAVASGTAREREHSAEVATGVKQLRELEGKIRSRYEGELTRLRSDAKVLSSQLTSLQAENARLQAGYAQAKKDAETCEQRAAQQAPPQADATEAEAAEGAAKRELVKIREDEERIASLKSENDQLRKDKEELETRLGALDSTPGALGPDGSEAKTAALENEVFALKRSEQSLQGDKDALVRTVQETLHTNQTRALQKQIYQLSQAQVTIQQRCEVEKAQLVKQMNAIKQKDEDQRETVETLQEQGLMAQEAEKRAKAELDAVKKDNANLMADKGHLMDSLRSVLKSNTKYQEELANDELQRSKDPHAQPPPSAAAKPTASPSGQLADPTAAMGETLSIDKYISKAANVVPVAEPARQAYSETAGDNELQAAAAGEARLAAAAREAEALDGASTAPAAKPQVKAKPKSKLKTWLGNVKAEDPEAAVERTVDADPKDNPDGAFGDQVSQLLRQAESAVSSAQDSDSDAPLS